MPDDSPRESHPNHTVFHAVVEDLFGDRAPAGLVVRDRVSRASELARKSSAKTSVKITKTRYCPQILFGIYSSLFPALPDIKC